MAADVSTIDVASIAAGVAGALFFIGDIIVLKEIFKRLFLMVKAAGEQHPPAIRPGSPLPEAYEQLPTTAAPSKTHVALLVLLKFILLVPVLVALLFIFEDQVPALFIGMLIGLVLVCAKLYFDRKSKG